MNIQLLDFTVNLLQSILWQYNNATNIISLTNQKQEWYNTNQTQFWQNWFDNIFNLATANQFGISVWSFILNLPLYTDTNPQPPNYPYVFGFNFLVSPGVYKNNNKNFNGDSGIGANFSDLNPLDNLTVDEQRFLLQLRYFQLTTRADIVSINSFLNYLFEQHPLLGPITALDGLNMTMRYVFSFIPSNPFLQALKDLDLLPRPAAVKISYFINSGKIFGFNNVVSYPTYENNNQNFNNGNFIPDLFFN